VEPQTWPLAILEPRYPAWKQSALRKTLNLAPCEAVELTPVGALLWIILIIAILCFSQQRICWVSISGAGGTLVELCWNLARTW